MEESHFLEYLEQTAGCNDVQTLTEHLQHSIQNYINAPLITIYTQQGPDHCRVIFSPKIPDLFLYQKPDHFLANQVLQQKKTLFQLLDDYKNQEVAIQIRQLGCQSLFSLPLVDQENNLIAVLSIFLCNTQPPDGDALAFVLRIATYVSSQLQRIFEFKKVSSELKDRNDSQTDLETLFDETTDFIAILDSRGQLKRINPALQKALKYPVEELLHRHICTFVHEEDRSYLAYLLSFMQECTCICSYAHRYVSKNGEEMLVEFNAQYLKDRRLIISTARNITDQKAMERHAAHLERSVAAERVKAEFFASVSHGLKTPLNVIQSSADLVRLKLLREDPELYYREYAKFFGYTRQNCHRLLRLITNLLDYTKLEMGDLRLNATPCQIDDYLWDTVEMVKEYADAVGCTLSLHGSLMKPSEYWLDADKVECILLNILSNSLKNCSSGNHVHVMLSENSTHLIVKVVDNGKGIPPALLASIFQRAHLSDDSLVKTIDGTGLGLCLSKALTELHDGTIQVKSIHHHGTEVTFTLSKTLLPSNITALPDKNTPETNYIATPYMRQSKVQMEMSDLSVMLNID